MKIRFTRHAKNRLRLREIEKEAVEETIRNPDRKERLSEDKFHYYKKVKKREMRVTIIQELKEIVVITAIIK